MHLPRIMIAGAHSSVGKTTMTLGVMAALKRQGKKVQPFKVGPDYIDPGLHRHAAGQASHNLDSWMGGAETVVEVFAKHAGPEDIAIIEGVMGLFDGARGAGIKGSSADIALILQSPVVLVVDMRGMAQSCIALVKGYRDYYPGLRLSGIIMNRASDYHRTWTRPAIEDELGIPVLGAVEAVARIAMPERHLGLLPAEENPELNLLINMMADLVENQIDLAALQTLAQKAPDLACPSFAEECKTGVRIGVARDQAFSFYYEDSLDYLRELGAELVAFSPLRDNALPEVDGLYFGGGFPEMFLAELEANRAMKEAICRADQAGMPIYAECGGYMYLCREIIDWSGTGWPGVGIVPAVIKMTRKLQALGYVEALALQDSVLARAGETLRGHEFHYSLLEVLDNPGVFRLSGGRSLQSRVEGYARGNLLASYLHLHLRSNPAATRNFIQACRRYGGRKRPGPGQTEEDTVH